MLFDFFKRKKKEKVKVSANLFLNIKDVQGNFLYTIDNKVLCYLRIFPKNCKLMSKEEQVAHGRSITKIFASELKPFKLYFTNRPIDLRKNQDFQASLMEKEKEALKFSLLDKRSRSFGVLSTTGKALESEIYLIIWSENDEYVEQDLIKRINEIRMKLTNSGYKTQILDERLIIQLINSYTNPDIAYIEDQNYLESPLQIKI